MENGKSLGIHYVDIAIMINKGISADNEMLQKSKGRPVEGMSKVGAHLFSR